MEKKLNNKISRVMIRQELLLHTNSTNRNSTKSGETTGLMTYLFISATTVSKSVSFST